MSRMTILCLSWWGISWYVSWDGFCCCWGEVDDGEKERSGWEAKCRVRVRPIPEAPPFMIMFMFFYFLFFLSYGYGYGFLG